MGADMNLDQATDLLRHTLILALVISAPMLIIGLVVGVIVSLVQAVTQIQEQTLTFVPKMPRYSWHSSTTTYRSLERNRSQLAG